MSPAFRPATDEHPRATGKPRGGDPLEWRPQNPRPSRIAPVIRDAILEPKWHGTRVLAHFDSQRGGGARPAWVKLVDEDGADATEFEPAVADALAAAVQAMDAVLDGFLTHQATRTGEGTSMSLRANVSPLQPLLPGRADVDVVASELGKPQETPIAFVAVDLLRLDGEELLDLPLLERKRLLEGVLSAGELVRVSPFARPPIGQWLASWKSAGFEGIVAKGANSRYRPSSETEEWAVYTRLR
jgi:bifunctional non-homologous end joining protein LigD